MNAKYWQKGETLDYTAAEKVTNGQVINLATRIGIAGSDIPAGAQGHVHVVGVFDLDKAEGEEIAMGASVYYDASADKITTTASKTVGTETVNNTPAGYAAAAAAAADATVLVKLLG